MSLDIAIPTDEGELWQTDPLEFAKRALPEHADRIYSAEYGCIWVAPGTAASGLGGRLGHIYNQQEEAFRHNLVAYSVDIVMAQLSPEGRCAGGMPIMWPGRAFYNGRPLGQDNAADNNRSGNRQDHNDRNHQSRIRRY